MTKKSTKKIEEEKEITRSEGNSTGPSQANLHRGVKGLSLHRVCSAAHKPCRPLSTQTSYAALSCENIFSSSRSYADICLPLLGFLSSDSTSFVPCN